MAFERKAMTLEEEDRMSGRANFEYSSDKSIVEEDKQDNLDTPQEEKEIFPFIKEAEKKVQDIFDEKRIDENIALRREMKKMADILEKSDKQIESLRKKIARREVWVGEGNSRLQGRYQELIDQRKSLVEETLSPFLEKLTLNSQRFFKASQNSGSDSEFTERLTANIEAIMKLEERMPGSSARLANDYGIQCFSRYPVHMLCRQLELEENRDTPYGVVLYSREDWNGAFDEPSVEELSLLDVATKRAGLGVRIFECDGLVDTAKRLINLDKKYGEQQKIQFAIVSGHGTPNSIELGSKQLKSRTFSERIEDSARRLIGKKAINDIFPEAALKKMKGFFVENPTLILNSCLTAKGEKGIAHLLAKITKSNVLASKKSVGAFEVNKIEKDGDRYVFDVTFGEKNLFGVQSMHKPRVISKE